MKKILLFTLALFTFFSCSTPEDKVKKEFEKYVQENFDNPDDLLEIVSIELEDTLSYDKMKKDGLEKITQSDKLEKISNKRLEEINKSDITENLISKASYEDKCKFIKLTDEVKDLFEYGTVGFIQSKEKFKNKVEETKESEISKINCVRYELKARLMVNGSKKLKSYYIALNKDGTSVIFDRPFTTEDYPEEFHDFVMTYAKFFLFYGVREEYYKEINEVYEMAKKYK